MKTNIIVIGISTVVNLMFTLPSSAIEAPVSFVEAQSETKAQGKLYDADLTDVITTPHGMCYEYSAYDRRDVHKTTVIYGHICGDKIVRY